ncbi:single-stranded DNA-binding protein [bacterium]|nr:single-stranded DNA-binding protein [bacterium]
MTLAKATVTGTVYKAPKTGYTQSNIAVSDFVMNIGTTEELLVRVISKRQALTDVVSNLSKNQKVLVSGRLQTGISKREDGSEKKVFEIDASSIELIGTSGSDIASSSNNDGDILQFGEMEQPSTSNNTDVLMDDEEIPF